MRYCIEIRRTTWVRWTRGTVFAPVFVEPASIPLGLGIELEFELPEGAREIGRVEGLAWRFANENGGVTDWRLVETEGDARAEAAARVEVMPVHAAEKFRGIPVRRT